MNQKVVKKNAKEVSNAPAKGLEEAINQEVQRIAAEHTKIIKSSVLENIPYILDCNPTYRDLVIKNLQKIGFIAKIDPTYPENLWIKNDYCEANRDKAADDEAQNAPLQGEEQEAADAARMQALEEEQRLANKAAKKSKKH